MSRVVALARRWPAETWRRRRARSLLAVVVGLPVAALLAASIFAAPGPFYFIDAVNHYYLVQQYHDDGSLLHYTVNSPVTGSFYPTYAMYGGTLYAATALVGGVVGSDWFAYGLTYLAAFAAAFTGVLWLARMAGLGADMAVLVSLVYVTSAYYLSNPYGRGAWPEFIATSAFPLVLAAVVSVLRADHPSRRSMAILIVATVVWSGSHLISVVYGTLFAILIGVTLALAATAPRTWPRPRSALLAMAAISAALAINGWFLVPQAVYARSTLVSSQVSTIYSTQLTHFEVLLSPFPAVSRISTVPHLYTNLPTLPLLWALAVLLVSSRRRSLGRLAWLTAALLAGYIALMASHRGWALVPRFLYVIQFPYRLLTYATLVICALAVLACRALSAMDTRSRQRWMLAGTAVIVCQVGFAGFQILQSRSTLADMRADIEQMERDGVPPNFYFPRDYRFIPDHPVAGLGSAVYATVLRPDGSATLTDATPRGSRVVVDVPDSPFVRVGDGATRAGATADGLLVIDVGRGPADIILTRAVPLPARTGRWLTMVGALSAVLLIVACPRLASPRRDDKADHAVAL